MTKEEILAMRPGRELDDLTAKKVMGLKLCGDTTQTFVLRINTYFPVRCYSSIISAAWEVVERLEGMNAKWVCSNKDDGYEFWIGGDSDHLVAVVKCKTLPEAICKAALIAVLEGEKE